MDLVLFLILNAVLLVRPEEFLPELEGMRLYLVVMVLCLLTSAPRIAAQLSWDALSRRPITVCVVGLLAAVCLSFAGRMRLDPAQEFVPEFAKVVLYYLLLVATIDTPGRLRLFLGTLVGLVLVVVALAVLQYHGSIDVPAYAPIERTEGYTADGEPIVIHQLRGSGTFNDPNDLCLILMTASVSSIYRAATASGWAASAAWLTPLGLFGYAVMLTQSRGGLLCLGAAVLGFLVARYGGRRAVPLAVVAVAGMAVLFAGRQTSISLDADDTAQQRLQLWHEGLQLLTQSMWGPQALLTGANPGEFVEELGHVAHNSFVQAYVELGLIGGGLFLGMFALSAWGLFRVRGDLDRDMAALRPCLFAIVVGYAVGNYSLSRNYVVPTYLVIGLASAYLAMVLPSGADWFRVDGRMRRRLAALSVGGFVFLYVFTHVFVRY